MSTNIARPSRKRSTKLSIAEPTLVPVNAYTELKGWDALTPEEQNAVKTEGEQLAVALLNHGRSKLAIGEHLLKIKAVLEPKKMFVRFLKTYHFTVKTAYRYMNGFTNAQSQLPEPVLQAAMARGYNMLGESNDRPLGIYTEAVKQLPPPETQSPEQVNTWLDSVEAVRKKTRGTRTVAINEVSVPQDTETLLKETFRFIDSRINKVPARERTKFAQDVISYTMTLAGMTKPRSFAPAEIPQGFKAERGRPRLVQQEATA